MAPLNPLPASSACPKPTGTGDERADRNHHGGCGQGGTYTSGAGAFLGGVSASDIASWLGIIGVIAGLAMQWYFNRRKDKRETAEHEARMSDYRHRQKGAASKPVLAIVAALSIGVAALVTPLVAKW